MYESLKKSYLVFLVLKLYINGIMLLLLLSHFSRVRLCATQRQQPTRLPYPWDSPGKNTGVACPFLLQCMQACQVISVVSDFAWPYGQWPTRLLCPQDSLGKNTGVGCHFLLQNGITLYIFFWFLPLWFTLLYTMTVHSLSYPNIPL